MAVYTAAVETHLLKVLPLAHLENATKPCSENTFGPASCRNDFDFTLLFEQSILSLAPSLIFIMAATWRLWQLRLASVKTLPDPSQMIKMVSLNSSCLKSLLILEDNCCSICGYPTRPTHLLEDKAGHCNSSHTTCHSVLFHSFSLCCCTLIT